MKPVSNSFVTLRRLALGLLLLNGVSATISGVMFILSPDGSLLQTNVTILRYTSFTNFLWPGILLLVFNGLSSLVITLLIIRNPVRYSLLIFLQGSILLIWLSIEVYLLETFEPLQLMMGMIAVMMMVCGRAMRYTISSNAAS